MKALSFLVTAVAIFFISCWSCTDEKPSTESKPHEPTKAADQSAYKRDSVRAVISERLTKADLAWYAVNTYGLDCKEVVSKSELIEGRYFIITCSNGKKLRAYPRVRKPPLITHIDSPYQPRPRQSRGADRSTTEKPVSPSPSSDN